MISDNVPQSQIYDVLGDVEAYEIHYICALELQWIVGREVVESHSMGVYAFLCLVLWTKKDKYKTESNCYFGANRSFVKKILNLKMRL